MVAGAIAAIAVLVTLVVFREDIGNFFREFKPTAPIAGAGKAVNDAGKQAGEAVGSTIIRPVAISLKEAELEGAARDAGFKPRTIRVGGKEQTLTARQARALKEDAGSVVIGSKNNVVNFGLIGEQLPTNPSADFIRNREKLLTPDQLRRFEFQQGLTPKGGQTSIGTNTIKVAGKNQIDPLAKTTKLFTNFGESFQKTLTGGSLFSELF